MIIYLIINNIYSIYFPYFRLFLNYLLVLKSIVNGSEKGEAAIEIERELAIKFINENIEKDEWLEEYFPKQMEVYHNAIEQTREQLLNQINL